MAAETPERIYHVSMGYFSIARYYGGCKLEGVSYTYEPETDSLVREDVLEREQKAAKAAKAKKLKGK